VFSLPAQQPAPDLSRMDVEDLMNIKVTSVSKREQSLARTAAAVYVIGQEDIRRSGAMNLPDLLRMVPGVDVRQIDANTWAISVRGFTNRYSNKVLVLIDGRSVYSASFSGVYWENHDMPLEDIERIEVIRGPGATVWGANAVNGVISIFTKPAKDTQGGLAVVGGGSQVHSLELVQYGGRAAGGNFRAFAKHFDIGNSRMPDGSLAADHWMRIHGGFRGDWDLSPRDNLMVQGDLFANEANQLRRDGYYPTPGAAVHNEAMDATGGDLLARWNHTAASGSQTSLQAYFDSYRRTDFALPEFMRSFDLDFQHHLASRGRHDLVWGLGYRASLTGVAPGFALKVSPRVKTDQLYSAFLQDEIRLADSLWLTAGLKVEHNPYTKFQTEPSIRLAWSPPGGSQTIWASASKALRQPARTDTSLEMEMQRLSLGPDLVQSLRLVGNPSPKNEELRDYELGYRRDLSAKLSFDGASFVSFYHHLNSFELGRPSIVPGVPATVVIPAIIGNLARAFDWGGEASVRWSITSRWRIAPGYSYLHAALRSEPESTGQPVFEVATDFPRHTAQLRSTLNLGQKTEFDQSVYYTARLPGSAIPGHVRVDLRLVRRLGERVEASVVGQNLLKPRATEYGDSVEIVGSQVVRSVYGQIAWRF
jgi:iron complex outermembrane recepter protein